MLTLPDGELALARAARSLPADELIAAGAAADFI
jgi:hypothetical protein